MAIQFILGRSGTGKTRFCIKAIVESLLGQGEDKLILLVPEQATYQAERTILSHPKVAGYNRLNVLSFDRLGFMLSGKNTARPSLSRIGQQMIIHKILREKKDELKLFGGSAERSGLGLQMAETIAELHKYAKDSHDIDRLVGELNKNKDNGLTVAKFADIAVVMREYLKFIENRFIDPDIQLAKTKTEVSQAEFIRGARVWVDGFSGFTTSEMAILTEVMKAASETKIAICLDPSEIDVKNFKRENAEPVSMFYPTQQTYGELLEIIRNCKLKVQEPIILTEAVRFKNNPSLGHIESEIFGQKAKKLSEAEGIRIIAAANARAEVKFAAREILRLVKEQSCRYRDIAIIASDISSYEHYIRAYFDDYGIPFFTDKRRPLNQYPLVHLIRSGLQAVASGFANTDVFAYLKTDLVPIERSEVDLLENYCLAFGVTGSDWAKEQIWRLAGDSDTKLDEEKINSIRLKAVRPLIRLGEKLCMEGASKKITSRQFTKIIFDFLDEVETTQTIRKWIDEENTIEEKQVSDKHRQFYEKMVAVFDEMCEIFSEQQMGFEDYFSIIDFAFSQLSLAFIPPTLDQVLVGSIDRSRHPDLKAIFLLGATARQFPSPINYKGILNDDDRLTADEVDFELAASTSEDMAQRQYLGYIAFTRPSERLYISYPAADHKGRVSAKSPFIDNVQELFESLNEETISDGLTEIEQAHNENELGAIICGGLGKDNEQFDKSNIQRLCGLFAEVEKDSELGDVAQRINAAIGYDNKAKLDKEIISKLYGKEIRSSATKLENFAGCPYLHFVKHILKLKKRQEFKLESLDLGNFYHRVLDGVIKHIKKEKLDVAEITDKELLAILKAECEKLAREDNFIKAFVSHRRHNLFIIENACSNLEEFVVAMKEMICAGRFRPAASEIKFGDKDNGLGEFMIEAGKDLAITIAGKIDRLDTAEIDGGKYSVIFDFKTKAKSFSWVMFYNGLDLQLPVYMLAVDKMSHAQKVVGAFYLPIEAKFEKAGLADIEKNKEKFNHKANGIFNGEFYKSLDLVTESGYSRYYNFYISKEKGPYGNYNKLGSLRTEDFRNFLDFTLIKIKRLGREIAGGEIDVKPYRRGSEKQCTYCEYKAVCRFDWQINKYNPIEYTNKENVLVTIGGKNGQ